MLGPAYASAQHRHHAAQIAFGLDGQVIFEITANPEFTESLGGLNRSVQHHLI
jgi:hypothetical protein